MRGARWMAWALAGALALGGAGCAAPRSGQTASPAQSAVSEPWDPLERLEEAGLSPEEAELVWQQLPDGYRAALEGREPPVWLAYLAAGHSRADVFAGFADSPEFIRLMDSYGVKHTSEITFPGL